MVNYRWMALFVSSMALMGWFMGNPGRLIVPTTTSAGNRWTCSIAFLFPAFTGEGGCDGVWINYAAVYVASGCTGEQGGVTP